MLRPQVGTVMAGRAPHGRSRQPGRGSYEHEPQEMRQSRLHLHCDRQVKILQRSLRGDRGQDDGRHMQVRPQRLWRKRDGLLALSSKRWPVWLQARAPALEVGICPHPAGGTNQRPRDERLPPLFPRGPVQSGGQKLDRLRRSDTLLKTQVFFNHALTFNSHCSNGMSPLLRFEHPADYSFRGSSAAIVHSLCCLKHEKRINQGSRGINSDEA